MLNIKFSKDEPADLKFSWPVLPWENPLKVISSGKPHTRIKFTDAENDQSLAIRTISKQVLEKKPGFDLLDWLGIRKRVILEVKDANGSKKGYVAVNAESLRKRLGLGKKEFYDQVKTDKGDITSYVESKVKERIKENQKKQTDQLNQLGINYLYGTGEKERDEAKAFTIFKQIGDTGEPIGYGNIAYCYSHGKGVEKDAQKAGENLDAMLKACGDDEKHKQMHLLSFSKLGVKEVEPFIEQIPEAQIELGKALQSAEEGRSTDEVKAFQLFEKVANGKDQNCHPYGLANLARCYSQGKGVEQNSTKAQECLDKMLQEFKKIGKEDEQKTKITKVLLELDQSGVKEVDDLCKKDPNLYLLMGKELEMRGFAKYDIDAKQKKMFEYAQKAAASGSPEGCALLARHYASGLGVEKKSLKAIEVLGEMTKLIKDDAQADRCLKVVQMGWFAF